MRRKEFKMDADNEETEQFLHEMSFGYLGTVSEDGIAQMTPLNYVYVRGAIYFHGSKIGEKMNAIRRNARVSFAVAKEYAIIPSYFTDPVFACPATSFFKSVYITGTSEIIDDVQEKAEAFTAFMRKLQPEGGYADIDPADPGYAKQLKATAVVKINVDSVNAKFKFGQNWPQSKLEAIGEQLHERGRELDAETAELMMRYCPAHRQPQSGEDIGGG